MDTMGISQMVRCIQYCLEKNKMIYVCGNGGSAATAEHLTCDLLKLGFSAISLTSNTAVLTMIANDYGYEETFKFQLETLLREGDLVIGISVSGNSENVLRAIEFAKEHEAWTVVFTGANGGHLADIADDVYHASTDDFGLAENQHLRWVHEIVRKLDV